MYSLLVAAYIILSTLALTHSHSDIRFQRPSYDEHDGARLTNSFMALCKPPILIRKNPQPELLEERAGGSIGVALARLLFAFGFPGVRAFELSLLVDVCQDIYQSVN